MEEPQTNPVYPCPEPGCGLVYDKRDSLRTHIARQHPERAERASRSNGGPFTCPEPGCGAVYAKDSALNMHVMRAHRGMGPQRTGLATMKPVPCPEPGCDASYSHINSLRTHLRRAHNKSIMDYADPTLAAVCPGCGKRFRSNSGLASHLTACPNPPNGHKRRGRPPGTLNKRPQPLQLPVPLPATHLTPPEIITVLEGDRRLFREGFDTAYEYIINRIKGLTPGN